MAGTYDHPEIDELLAAIDEVLEECPGPTTSDPSTGTPSSHLAGQRAGQAERGRKKSKSPSGTAPVGPSELDAVAS